MCDVCVMCDVLPSSLGPQPLRDLDNKINGFMQHYMIVEQESLLRETANKLETTIKQAHAVSRRERERKRKWEGEGEGVEVVHVIQ